MNVQCRTDFYIKCSSVSFKPFTLQFPVTLHNQLFSHMLSTHASFKKIKLFCSYPVCIKDGIKQLLYCHQIQTDHIRRKSRSGL